MDNIKLKDIIACPWNVRGEITDESVSELAQSIREQGLINPITLWKDGGQTYCIAGNRRLAALRTLHGADYELSEKDGVMPFAYFVGSEDEARIVTVTENLQREGISALDEAALVKEMLDAGVTADEVAAKTGRSASWVRRRVALCTLDEKVIETIRKSPSRVDVSVLERVAALPTESQSRICKSIARQLKADKDTRVTAQGMRLELQQEQRNLDGALFANDEDALAACRSCARRTGAMPDLWNETDRDKLGACLDKACYARMEDAFKSAEVKRVCGDAEAVEVYNQWSVPDEAKHEKRSKASPCAYYYWSCGAIHVTWGPSQKAIEKRREKERTEREAADEANRALRDRRNKLTQRLEDALSTDDDGNFPAALVSAVQGALSPNAGEAMRTWITRVVCDDLCQWHSLQDWASIITAFDAVPKIAGLTNEDIAFINEQSKEK